MILRALVASSRPCAGPCRREKLFVDYSGHTLEVIDARTGELRNAQTFVAVLGAANYTYAEASFSQSLPDWIGAHVRAFSFFGGAARQTVSDNLKAGITRALAEEREPSSGVVGSQ